MLIQKDGGNGPYDVLATCLPVADVVLIPIRSDDFGEDERPITKALSGSVDIKL